MNILLDAPADDASAAVHASYIQRLARMRCRAWAEEALGRAQDALGERAELLVAHAHLEREFDRWPQASALLRRAVDVAGAESVRDAARLELVEALMALGQVEAAAAALEQGAARSDARAELLRAALAAERGDLTAERAALARAIAAPPDKSGAADIRLDLAVAMGIAGQYGAARELLEDLRAHNESEPLEKFAAARLARLSSAPPADAASGSYAVRLTARPAPPAQGPFGPPILALYARYAGLDFRAEGAGAEVSSSATLYELAESMRACGIVARRVAATPRAVFDAIDLGVPLLVQDANTPAAPVQLIVGYDRRLSVFICRDPQSQRHVFLGFEHLAEDQDLYGNGATILLGRVDSPQARALVARADALGLVDAAHLEHLDTADRLWRGAQYGAPLDEDQTIEAVTSAADALRTHPGNRYALLGSAWAQLMFLRGQSRDDLRTAIRNDLFRLHWHFPGEPWVHRAHGNFLLLDARPAEAWVSFADAQETGGHSAALLHDLAAACVALGNLDDARKHLHAALTVDPSFTPTWQLLADVDHRLLQGTDDLPLAGDGAHAAIAAEQKFALRVLQEHRAQAARAPGET